MRRAIPLLLLVLLSAAALPAAAQPADLEVPAPAGWTGFDETYRYGRESLWEYINGAAEQFLTYRFRELAVADFERGDLGLTVCVYDMGHPLDAFGIFETERPADAETLDAPGAAAVLQAPYQGLMIKDRFYVKIEAGGGDLTAEVLRAALSDVAAGLPGTNDLPPELAALPEDGRKPGTVAFAGSNFLGFEDLGGCLYAEYEGGDADGYRLFVLTPGAALLGNDGGRWTESERDGRRWLSRTVPYRGIVLMTGDASGMIGVCGVDDPELGRSLLEARLD